MPGVERLRPMTHDTPAHGEVYGAWERFVHGEDDIRGVRPEVAISWQRCRDRYHVDPFLPAAPVAATQAAHPLEHDVVFTELGFRAAIMAHEVANVGAIVTVADAGGRILAEWGDTATRSIAAEAGLAPWYCWSESAVGTNGMGTALGSQNTVVTVRREEHWCRIFHDWTCAGVAVRDVVSKKPIAALNISTWRGDLPAAARSWLRNAAADAQSRLRVHARDGGAELVAAYHQGRTGSAGPSVAVDTAGKIVIADDEAAVLLGVPSNIPAVDPAVRWLPQLPALIHAAAYATRQAGQNPEWTGSTQIFTNLTDEPSPIAIRPVFLSGNLVGHLIYFGVADGRPMPRAEATPHPPAVPERVMAVHDDRIVLLRFPEVAVAESDGNDVWLTTDEGRLRAASSGLDRLDAELADAGFLRVHRQYIVNLGRVREVERHRRGELMLVMDDRDRTTVPVSRRNTHAVRLALGV